MFLLHCSAIFCYYSANISAVLLQRWVSICACTNVKRAEDALKVELQVIVSCHKGAGTKTQDLGRSRKRSVSEPSLATSILAYHNAAVCFELYKISVLVIYVFIHQSLWSDQHTTMYTYMCSHSACEHGCSAHCGCAQLAPSKRCSLSMYPNSCGEMIFSLGNTYKVELTWIDLTWQWQHCRQYLYSVNKEQTADRSVPVMVPSKGECWVQKHLPSQDQLTSSGGSEAGGAPHLDVSRKVQFELEIKTFFVYPSILLLQR